MNALPPGLAAGAGEQVSGIACPDCPGVLNVSMQGIHGYLHFRCRIGHSYSADELLAAKERQFEDHVWSAVTSLEELQQLLRDLGGQENHRQRQASFAARIERGAAQSRELRRIVEETQVIELPSEPGDDGE